MRQQVQCARHGDAGAQPRATVRHVQEAFLAADDSHHCPAATRSIGIRALERNRVQVRHLQHFRAPEVQDPKVKAVEVLVLWVHACLLMYFVVQRSSV